MGSNPTVLMIDDGELDDVAALLGRMPAELVRVDGGDLADPPPGLTPCLVIATGRRALTLDGLPTRRGAPAPVGVAVVTASSRTLRVALRRMGFQYLVHRPVHPGALRLLIARLLYAGRERRHGARVAIGAVVSFRAGLRRRQGTLLELSVAGCRLLANAPLSRGSRVTLQLPEPDDGGALTVRGGVLRSTISGDGREVAIGFDPAPDAIRARVERLVQLHADGPAAWSAAPPGAQSGRRRDPRRNRRSVYTKRVIALSGSGARVVLGRDLSIGGMRVEAGAGLENGQILQIALHGGSLRHPVIVRARVVRRGVARDGVLRFLDVDEPTREAIAKLVADEPEIESLGPQGVASRRTFVTTLLPAGVRGRRS